MEAVVVDLHHRAVLHGADGGVFARELAALLGVLHGRLADLEGDIAAERDAVGEIDHGARGLAELVQDGVLRQVQMRGIDAPWQCLRRPCTRRQRAAARAQGQAQCGCQPLRVEQAARQIVGGAQPHRTHGAQLVAAGGNDDHRRHVIATQQQPQWLQTCGRVLGRLAALRSERDQVQSLGRQAECARFQLRQFQLLDRGVGPQDLDVVAQPGAQLAFGTDDEQARVHGLNRSLTRTRCATATPSRSTGR